MAVITGPERYWYGPYPIEVTFEDDAKVKVGQFLLIHQLAPDVPVSCSTTVAPFEVMLTGTETQAVTHPPLDGFLQLAFEEAGCVPQAEIFPHDGTAIERPKGKIRIVWMGPPIYPKR